MSRLYGILQQLIKVWQAKDIDGVLAFMDDEIVWHYAAGAMPPVRGKATAAKLLSRFQADMHNIEWRLFAYAESGDRLFIEGVDEYQTADGRRVAAPYAGVLEFKGDRIIGWRDYVDIGVIADQKEGRPITPQVEQLINRPVAATH
jgi:limonene-1,2-epoxide hydrolase